MATTLTLTINTSVALTALSRNYTGSISITDTASGGILRQTIGTSDEVLIVGDVATNGYFYAKNADVTNYLELGYTSGTYFAKLKAGEACVFRLGSGVTVSAIHAKANTGACVLEYFILPD